MKTDLSLKPMPKPLKMQPPTFQCKTATVQPSGVRTVRKSQNGPEIVDFIDFKASTSILMRPMDVLSLYRFVQCGQNHPMAVAAIWSGFH